MRRIARRSVIAAVVTLLLSTVALAGRATAAAPSYVQGADGVGRSGTTATTTAVTTTAGDLLVAFVVWDNLTGVKLSDTAGDGWVAATPRQPWQAGAWSAQTFYAPARGGTVTVKATFTQALSRFGQVYVSEYANVQATVDAAAAKRGTGSAMTAGPLTTTQPGDLLFAGGASANAVVQAAAGWTTRSTSWDNRTADAIAGAPGAYSTGMTQNGAAWVLQMVAFRAADPSTTTTTTTVQPTTTTTSTSTSSTMTSTSTTTTTMPSGGHGADACAFSSFCEMFMEPTPGGRGGDLDETRWSFARTTQATNPTAGLVNNYPPVDAEFCTTRQVRIADNDSFICGEQFGEHNHWMEAMDDQDSYVAQSARILQPFDFAGRTSTFDFSVDAKTAGSHSAWVEAWLTADPQQVPHEDFPGTHMFPREGIQILLNADWCGPAGTANAVRQINEYHGYQLVTHDFLYSPCFTTQGDMANHFQVRVSQSRVEVWASDKDGTHLALRAAANVNLPFTRGYWNLQHAQYAADKFNDMNPTTYHWHAVSFDGPVLPVDGSYQVPDALTPGPNGSVNLGYQTPTPTFTLSNVDPAGAGYVTFNVYWYSSPTAVNLNVNGVTQRVPDPTPDVGAHSHQWHFLVVPVGNLHSGSNTVQIANTGCGDSCPTVANVDVEVVR